MERANETRRTCPLTTDPHYAAVAQCELNEDGSGCLMSGIASACAYKRSPW